MNRVFLSKDDIYKIYNITEALALFNEQKHIYKGVTVYSWECFAIIDDHEIPIYQYYVDDGEPIMNMHDWLTREEALESAKDYIDGFKPEEISEITNKIKKINKELHKEIRDFIITNGVCKAISFRYVKGAFITDLSKAAQDFIYAQCPEKAIGLNPCMIKLDGCDRIRVLDYVGKKYLVYTEGYDYPRYIVRIS